MKWLLENPEYEHKPVTMQEYLDNDFFTTPQDKPRIKNREILIEFFDSGNYDEMLFIAGIGCHVAGTKILMEPANYTGTTKKVEDIVRGDVLVGDDGWYRRVIATHTGVDYIYKIKTEFSENLVNAGHLLHISSDGYRFNMPIAWFYKLPEAEKKKCFLIKYGEIDGVISNSHLVNFSVEFCNYKDTYYGFEVDRNHLYLTADGIVHHNSGKSYLSSMAISYIIYRLLCLKNPQLSLMLGKNTKIAFINISTSKTQAKDVVFGEIKNRIDNNVWFQTYSPPNPRILSYLKFKKNIYVLPLGSNEQAPLGYNIFGAVLDEASFHVQTKEKDYAEESYNQIKKRIVSRYEDVRIKERGKMFIITSPRYIYDFAETKYHDDTNPKLYKNRLALWDAKPVESYCGQKFDLGKYLSEMAGTMVPVEYEQEFIRNPEKAMRDLGARPSVSIQGFFRDPSIIKENANEKRQHPWNAQKRDFYDWFHNIKGSPTYDNDRYYIHVDLGMHKEGKGDKTGFCVAEGQKILMSDLNYKNIEDINIGDSVISSNGCCNNVLNKFNNGIKDVFEITSGMATKIIATDSHKFLSVKRLEISQTENNIKTRLLKYPIIGKKVFKNTIKKYEDGYIPKYRTLKELSLRDFLCVPKPKIQELNSFMSIDLTEEVGYLVGIFIAEGSYWKHSKTKKSYIQVSLGRDEQDIVSKVQKIISDNFNIKTRTIKTDHGITIRTIYSKTLYDFLFAIAGEYAINKDIKLALSGNKEFHKGLINGLIDGDGYINRLKNRIGFKTISKKLAEKLQWLLISYGFMPTVTTGKEQWQTIHNNKKPSLCKKSFAITLKGKKQVERYLNWSDELLQVKASENINTNNYILVPIKSINNVGNKCVYDIEVENQHDYIVNKIAVHNCMGKLAGWKKYQLANGRMEKRPIIYIAYMHAIEAPTIRDEIKFEDIRKRIYRLREIGWNINTISYDGFNAVDSRQILQAAGFKSEYLSVDRTPEPYYTMKEAILEDRMDYYDYAPFIEECQQLEEIKGNKVDHPSHGCLLGNTKIRIDFRRHGKPNFITIKELADMGKDYEFQVYSYDNGKIVTKIAYNAHKTKTVTSLLRVWLDNDKSYFVDCTENHLFLMADGTYKQAQELQKGNYLMPFNLNRLAGSRRVKSIKIHYGTFDVYDITVPETQNFAIKCGVFVHNSKDCSDSVAGVAFHVSKFKPGSGILGASTD